MQYEDVHGAGQALLVTGHRKPLLSEHLDMHAYQMQRTYDIPQCLKMYSEQLDGEFRLWFPLNGKRMLTQWLRLRPLSAEDAVRLFRSLRTFWQTMSEYMLSAEHLLLDPDYIYCAEREHEFTFLHIPVKSAERESLTDRLRRFCERLQRFANESGMRVLQHATEQLAARPFVVQQFFICLDTLPAEQPAVVLQPAYEPQSYLQYARSQRARHKRIGWLVVGVSGWLAAVVCVLLGFIWPGVACFGGGMLAAMFAWSGGQPRTDSKKTDERRTDNGPVAPEPAEPLHRTVLLREARSHEARSVPYLHGVQNDQWHRMEPLPHVLGRDEEQAHLRLAHLAASRLHAEIGCTDEQYAIRDLGSRNGTTVNETRLIAYKWLPLKDGDRIQITGEEFTFVLRSENNVGTEGRTIH